MKELARRWLPSLLAAVAVAVLLHADVLVRHFHASPDKVGLIISGPRTDIGDDYYYFTMLRHAPERILAPAVSRGDPDGGDHRNVNAVSDAYAAALYVAHALYQVAASLTPTSRDALLLNSVLHTTALAFAFLIFLTTLLDGTLHTRWFLLLVLTYVGLVFVDAFGNSVYFAEYFYWNDDLLTYRSNPTRLLNPTLFWAAGLGAAAFIVRWLRESRTADFYGALALAGVTALFNVSVGATLVLTLGLAIGFELLVQRTLSLRLLLIALAAIAGLAWSYVQLKAYGATALGQELRHGEFLGLKPKWQFLFLLGLIPLVWRALGRERVFVSALVLAAMTVGMFCDSFHLGSRLWLRGAVIYAWAVTVFTVTWLAMACLGYARRLAPICSKVVALPLKGGVLVLMVAFVVQVQRPDVADWKGFVERDKWELLDWIDRNLPAGSVVASADIEDAFLLPIYTRAKPFYTMYGLTSRSRDEELRRYFYNMRLYGRDSQQLAAVLALGQPDLHRYHAHVMGTVSVPYRGDMADAAMFFELVFYHAYVRALSNALTDPVQHQELERLLRKRADEAARSTYVIEYAIVDSRQPPSADLAGWPVIHVSGRHALVGNPATREPY